MARGFIRNPSFGKMVGAYRSQWKRFWRRLFSFGLYGRKGMGWLRDPKKAWYNWWYHRTSISLPRLLGYKPSFLSCLLALTVASIYSVLVSPFDAMRAGVRAHKSRQARKKRAEAARQKASASANRNKNASAAGSAFQTATRASTPRSKATLETRPPQAPRHYEPITILSTPEPIVNEPDENTPKSKPKKEGDQYIRKRMIIAGSSYCDRAVLARLSVGAYIELIAEPDNPYDKDAIMLVYEGEKIGYVAKRDKAAFVTCLRLGRTIYGVITDITTEPYPPKYEYETWFSC